LTIKLPSLNALRAFECAARHLSISRAGDELSVTHSAVSHQIRNLEVWFGKALFERAGRAITLTDTGSALFASLAPLFAEMSVACGRLRAPARRNSLVVGCIPSIASRWLVPHLNLFSDRHKGIEIRVVYARAHDRLIDGDLDILITLGHDEADDVVATRLFSRASRPVASPHFLSLHGPMDSLAAIASAALLHDEDREGWRAWVRTAGLSGEVAAAGPIFQDFNMLATALIAGHGVALCPTDVFRNEIERGDIIVLSDIEIDTGKSYYVLSRKSKNTTVDTFIRWFLGVVDAGKLPSKTLREP
jgi:LysR family transcriptional regulator, glycine cleavage system transcriptional activator